MATKWWQRVFSVRNRTSANRKPPTGRRSSPLHLESLEVRLAPTVGASSTPAILNVVLISNEVVQAEQVRMAAAPNTIAIIYDSETMTTSGLVNLLSSVSAAHNDSRIEQLGIVTHDRRTIRCWKR